MKLNLGSTKLAFFLIASLVVLVLVSAIIPQQDIAVGQIIDWETKLGDNYAIIENLGLDRIYYTPTFFVVIGLLALNLTVGNIKRFRLIYRTDKTIFRLRHFGSILFHLSLLLTMAAIVLHYLFKYEGVFSLTEGQSAADQVSSYHREFKGPLYSDDYGNFSISLESIQNASDDIGPSDSRAAVILTPPTEKAIKANILTNHPLRWKDWEFHFGSTTGYSPEVLLLDSAHNELFRSFVRVAHQKHGGQTINFDYVYVPDHDLRVEIEVIPAGAADLAVRYRLDIQRDDSLLFSGELEGTDTTAFADYKVQVPRLRRWCYIGAIKNPFLNLIFTGFWLSLAGLSLSLVTRVVQKRTRL
jgi:hypothetical protein